MTWGALPLEAKLLAALVTLQILDVVTGWLAAYLTGTVNSRLSWSGVSRKALTICVVLVVGVVNAIAPSPLSEFPLLVPALIGYIGSEAISIFENVRRTGVPLPSPLDRAFRARGDLHR